MNIPTYPENYPIKYESYLTLKNGKEIFLRPIMPTDEYLVVDFFERLSADSVRMRFLSPLRALPKELLHRFIHTNYDTEFALLGIIEEDRKDAIIAIARYAYSPEDNIADFGVTVRDDWQNLGLGKSLLKRIVEIGQEHGYYRFGSMIDPQNKIIMQILADLGYEMTYTLKSGFFEVEVIAKA